MHSFRIPTYKHDPKIYKAACAWLGYPTLPNTPLTEWLYQYISSDMVKTDDGWVFSAEQAALSTEQQAQASSMPIDGPLPRRAFEQFLRSLYQGMYEAHMQGISEGPTFLGLASASALGLNTDGQNIPLMTITKDATGTYSLFFVNMEALREDLIRMEALLNDGRHQNILELKQWFDELKATGFRAQCKTHFLNKELAETPDAPTDGLHRDGRHVDPLVEAQVDLWEQQARARNKMN